MKATPDIMGSISAKSLAMWLKTQLLLDLSLHRAL
jgi:hypothetical protein